MLANTKEDFEKFSTFYSNSIFHSSTSDEVTSNSSSFEKDSTDSEVNSLGIELSASDSPDLEFSSTSFMIYSDEESFEERLLATSTHLKDDISHSSYYFETPLTSFTEF